MLSRAKKDYESNTPPPPRNALAKQLFPSSSPSANADIREQFMRPTGMGSEAAPTGSSAMARTGLSSFSNPLIDRSANIAHSHSAKSAGKPGMASLYGGHAKAFEHATEVIDLTSQDAQAKAQAAVPFDEDDFSDDDFLDLDVHQPIALPTKQQPKPPATPNPMPPPPATSQTSQIPWSSSPASHHLPPRPQRAISDQSNASDVSLKRESPGYNGEDCQEIPAPKKVKRRVLPASFRASESTTESSTVTKTPASKSNGFWDPTASAVKEQRKQLKSSRQPKRGQSDGADGVSQHPEAHHSKKSEAIHLSKEQENVLDLVVNEGRSVFFTGPAGTGKSVLMRAIIAKLKEKHSRDPERVSVTASTGLAACNIGGMTLHSFSGIGLGKEEATDLVKKIRRNAKAKSRWLKTKTLIIDEISMVDGDLFDKLSQIGRTIRNNGRPWGGIQLVITGDFFQLPPVPDGEKKQTKFAFDAKTWTTSIDHTIGLTQVFRQRDPEFARMLNEMRLGRISEDTVKAFRALSRPLKFDDGVDLAELFPTRAQVDNANLSRIGALKGKVQRFEAHDIGKDDIRDKLLQNVMAPKILDLKVDAQVMLIKNLDETLVNGSLGKVIGFSDEKTFDMGNDDQYDAEVDDNIAKARKKLQGFSRDADSSASTQKFPVVQFMGTDGTSRVILCQPEEWKVELPNGEVQAKRTQLPLILAWALSIHKAQGQTLERVTVNLGKIFEKGQAYVALSRATSQAGLRVLGFEKSKVMAHPDVIAFYNKLYSAEEALGRKPSSIAGMLANKKGVSRPMPVPAPKRTIQTISRDEEEALAAAYGH